MLHTIFQNNGEEEEGGNLSDNLRILSGIAKGTTPIPEPDLQFQRQWWQPA
jgi:hypothetical protein